MVKRIQDVDMDWQAGQARLDHYNKWLMDPKRPIDSVYPGYPGDKNDSYSEGTRAGRKVVTKPVAPKSKSADNEASVKEKSMTKLATATEIVKSAGSKAEALAKIVETLGVTKANAYVYFTKAQKALVGDAYPNLKVTKAPKAEKPAKVRTSKVTELSEGKHKAKVAEIDAVIAGLRASGASVTPFTGL